ncbi:MAG: nuclear transport factor 2 family protein [Roseivirga sp.]|nr:nuclear transport factor 2 family protein [Roseivirga sp.]
MRKTILSLLVVIIGQLVYAQSEQEAINKDVWLNFMEAYENKDASLFNQIHTDDVLRISPDRNTIHIGQEYKDRNLETFNRWNDRKVKQKIEFSFLSRSQKRDWAYEVGIFKLTRHSGTQSQSYYGKFHVTLKKVSGIWKIFIDSDTNENNSISETDFQQGEPLNY